ncbi:hypothetical protein HGRIS_002418 [Hohenbuehelia grisea]|uniref:Secreted protein n=1 Tax=Hohenbuehelia grisea TaxID=104357 RepID=A0ABR3JKF1_9AGAR
MKPLSQKRIFVVVAADSASSSATAMAASTAPAKRRNASIATILATPLSPAALPRQVGSSSPE